MSRTCYTLEGHAGTARLSRFELAHMVSMLILEAKQQGLPDLGQLEAERMVLRGESPLYIQRSYTDGSVVRFRILAEGLLEPLHQ